MIFYESVDVMVTKLILQVSFMIGIQGQVQGQGW